eukprot:5293940-Alexandrium_andersonii.AAC.1
MLKSEAAHVIRDDIGRVEVTAGLAQGARGCPKARMPNLADSGPIATNLEAEIVRDALDRQACPGGLYRTNEICFSAAQ